MTEQSITVRHNIEVAHRLYESPGKCEAIHGHSMWVDLTMWGKIDQTGKLCGLDFGYVKQLFRTYLDTHYDHHLLLNEKDPWANTLITFPFEAGEGQRQKLPGLQALTVDPTTENLARIFGEWASSTFSGEEYFAGEAYPEGITKYEVQVQETHVNFASWTYVP